MSENKDPNDYMEMVKKQWEAMGIDPNQMLSYMNNSMEMQKNITENFQNIMANNPLFQQLNSMNGTPSQDDLLNLYDDSPEIKEDTDLTEEEIKAVVCGANLTYKNSGYLNTLSTYLPTDSLLDGLESMWGINNKQELLETLDWLEQSGHKVYFNLIWEKLRTVPKAEWRLAIKNLELQLLGNKEIEGDRLMTYATNFLTGYPVLLQHGCFKNEPKIESWDLARAINLCRMAYDVEFLTKEEAMEKIKYYASKLFNIYDSWKSLSEGYIMGFTMWNGDEDLIDDLLNEQEVLLSHEKSPWTKIKW